MADLRERVEAELANIEACVSQLPPPGTCPTLSPLELYGTAVLLQGFFNGIENVLKQVVIAKRLPFPVGDSWHRQLVELAESEGVLSHATVVALDEYRAFRHFLAHAYAVRLRAELVQPLVAGLPTAFTAFRTDLERALARIVGS